MNGKHIVAALLYVVALAPLNTQCGPSTIEARIATAVLWLVSVVFFVKRAQQTRPLPLDVLVVASKYALVNCAAYLLLEFAFHPPVSSSAIDWWRIVGWLLICARLAIVLVAINAFVILVFGYLKRPNA